MKEQESALKIYKLFQQTKNARSKFEDVWTKVYSYMNNWVDGKLGQWDNATRTELESVGKPAISFNEIRKFANRICGAQVQTKADAKVFPRDGDTDPAVAEILTDLIKYVKDLNKAPRHKNRAFRDMIATGWGWIKVEWGNDLDPFGEIQIRSVSPRRVYVVGMGEQYDLYDRKGIIEVLPMDTEDVKARWPEKAKKITGLYQDIKEKKDIPVGGYDYDFSSISHQEVYDNNEDKLLVLRAQLYEYKSVQFLKMPDGTLKEMDENQGKVLAEAMGQMGINMPLVKKLVKKVKITYCIGDTVLEESWSPYKHNRPDLIALIAYNDDGVVTGPMQDLIDPQDEKNKRHSQIVHILGTSAKNSYFTKKGAIDDIDKARKDLGKVSTIIEVNGSLNEALRPIESNLTAVPAIIQMDLAASSEMKEISGLHDASMGQVPQGVKSGRGISELQQPTEIIIGELFEHFMQSSQMMDEMILSLIQQFYTEERRVRILGDYSKDYIDPNIQTQVEQGLISVQDGAKLITINKEQLGQRLNDVTVGRYDVVIDQVSQNPTTRRAKFFDLLNMRSLGLPISPRRIVEASDVPGKMQILAEMDKVEQQMAMQAMMGQIAKTATPSQQMPTEGDLKFNLSGAQQPQ